MSSPATREHNVSPNSKNDDTLCAHVYTDATKRALSRGPLPLDGYPKDPDRTMTAANLPWQADKPYNDLPPLPPTAELETRAVLKRCIEARTALAELKQAAELIPNQTVLINTIPLLEAKDSSEIESIVTTTDLLFQHAQDGDSRAFMPYA
ncbi:hypothetical protein D9M68_562860 [compost metagenome]